MQQKVELGVTNDNGVTAALKLLENMSSWIITQTNEDKTAVEEFVQKIKFPFQIFSLEEINKELEQEDI